MIAESGARGRFARGGTGLNTAGVPFPAGRAPVHSLPFSLLAPTSDSFRDRFLARVERQFLFLSHEAIDLKLNLIFAFLIGYGL